jgi:hypothetical protein
MHGIVMVRGREEEEAKMEIMKSNEMKGRNATTKRGEISFAISDHEGLNS